MATRNNPYSNLHFESWVDWQHVQPALLAKVNAIAKSKGQIVDIFSGYRDPKYNQKVGGAEHSLHTQGRAIDAYVNGQPIGEVWAKKDFDAAGLRTGNQANFFHGKPDPEHVDLGFDGSVDSTPAAEQPVTSYAAPLPVADDSQADANVMLPQQNDASIGRPVGPNVLTPRTTSSPFVDQGLPPRFQTWQALSQLPGASPDTMRFTQMAGYEDNADG